MNGTLYGMALVDVMDMMRNKTDGAITTGITPEPDGRATPATSPAPADDAPTRGNLLSRAWRLAARPAARPKAAGCPTC